MDHSQSINNPSGNAPPSVNLKYKTSRCRHFDQTGNCQLAERCHFAHGDRDLRTINDPISKEQVEYAQRPVQYTKPGGVQPAQMINGGNMPPQPIPGQGYVRGGGRGGRGGFSQGGIQESHHHSAPTQMQMHGAPGMQQWNPRGPGMQQHPQPHAAFPQQMMGQDPKTAAAGGYANFKTVKCKFFDQGKNCPYKDRCSFAHGETELRQSQGLPLQMPGSQQFSSIMPSNMPIPSQGAGQFMGQGGVGNQFGAYQMPVDMMQQHQMAAGGHPGLWGAPQYQMMGAPGHGGEYMGMPQGSEMMMHNVQQPMMMGHPGMPQMSQMSGPQGAMQNPVMMMPGMMQQAQNPLDLPFRFQFPQHDSSGKYVTHMTTMDVYFLDRSESTIAEVQRAQQLNAEGNTKDCLNMLMALYEKNKVMIQQVDAQPPVQ